MTKQREFWIEEDENGHCIVWNSKPEGAIEKEPRHKFYHVIEVNPALDKAIEHMVARLELIAGGCTDPSIAEHNMISAAKEALASYKAALGEK